MAERSFHQEVQKLRLGDGDEFRGEGILAITKALLQSGVSYVAGYQGAPISHLMDVLGDANDILEELGVHFESSASEATAAATLAASVNYPLRGAVTFKSPVGTNVASDALANLASGGVMGGALIIMGEDYGEGSSIMQERSHAFAMKSQLWLLDPRPNLPTIVRAVEKGFELSEASNTPVMLEVRIRACHVHGRFPAKDNVRPSFTLRDALETPRRAVDRIVLPPESYLHEKEKIDKRWPAAVKFIVDEKLNEFFDGDLTDIGIIMQGGMYNTTLRALEVIGLADAFGKSRVPIYVMNVTYPLIDAEIIRFAQGKRAVIVVEEGQPEFIEQAINTILRRADVQTAIEGKGVLPMAGEYTGAVVRDALTKFIRKYRADVLAEMPSTVPSNEATARLATAVKTAGASAFNIKSDKRAIAIIGDGGFWHNGLVSSVGNAVFNKSNNVHIIVDNGYTSATGGQDIMSSSAHNAIRATHNTIEKAVKGVGVEWVRTLTNTYNIAKMRDTLREALTTKEPGPKVIIAQSECMLNKQRRVRPLAQKAIKNGERVVRERFGVDSDTCTGDHSCIRLSGCPSLTIAPNPDPLRTEPITKVINSCVGCGLCGEVAHAAVLCPSFYKASIINNPSGWDRFKARVRGAVIGFLQRRLERRQLIAA